MTDDEIIAVVQAHKEGKKIEYRNKFVSTEWRVLHLSGDWGDFSACDYRVAPEPRKPREWWIEPGSGGVDDRLWQPREQFRPLRLVRVREVIE